jgi:hypothetical protein
LPADADRSGLNDCHSRICSDTSFFSRSSVAFSHRRRNSLSRPSTNPTRPDWRSGLSRLPYSYVRTREWRKCRAPTVANLSKGASARVDADAITTPSVPRLAHVYSASDFLCLFRFAHFPASRPTVVFSSSCQSRLLPAFAQHESPRTPPVTSDNIQRRKGRSQCSVDPQFASRLETVRKETPW